MAQIYGVCWVSFTMSGVALWPIFVKRRNVIGANLRIWGQMTGVLSGLAAVVAVVFVLLAPLQAGCSPVAVSRPQRSLRARSGSCWWSKSTYLASNMLLTRPEEARWQAWCALATAALSVGLGALAGARFGAVGVTDAAAFAVLTAQVVPALLWVPRMVRRRPEATV